MAESGEKLSKDMDIVDAQMEIDKLGTESDVLAFVDGEDRQEVLDSGNDRVNELSEASAPTTEPPADDSTPDLQAQIDALNAKLDATEAELEEERTKAIARTAPLTREELLAQNESLTAALKKHTDAAEAVEEAKLMGTMAILNAQEKVNVLIQSTETDNKDVFVAINGYAYQIKRGVAVDIPRDVFQVIQDANQEIFVQKPREDGQVGYYLEGRTVNRFSFQAQA